MDQDRVAIAYSIFPCRMKGNGYEQLKLSYPMHQSFWKELEQSDLLFQYQNHFDTNKKSRTSMTEIRDNPIR